MIRFPNCKINLGLYVLEKLPDGYHQLETAFYPVGLSDILEINTTSSVETMLNITGTEIHGAPSDNLCFRAWQILHAEYGIPAVEMHLHKIIPIGAGLGGGSSDAAFTLSMLNELFEIGIPLQKLDKLAARLGMDCPYFLLNAPALGQGKGDILTPLSVELKGMHIAILKPGIHISTSRAYASIKPHPQKYSIQELIQRPINEWKYILSNDFEEGIFDKYPVIAEIKQKLYQKGAVYASMSGSGSAVYGIFKREPELAGSFEGSFAWQGSL
jgi:4-diphosphocytidyl-2-C-methyl-D-erythritol kinase